MIKNEKQYQVTQKKLISFQAALYNLRANKDLTVEEIAVRAGFIEAQIEIFEEELSEFQLLKEQKITWLSVCSFSEVADALVKARIARGWTQADLAGKLGLKEQQIQRYESSDYKTASLARFQQVFDALELQLKGCRVILDEPKFILPEHMQQADFKRAQEKLRQSRLLEAVAA